MIVLDASAVLAVIFREPGAERVIEQALGSAISAVNHAEVISRLADEGADRELASREISRLRFEVTPFDQRQAEHAGYLRSATRHIGLSLGDRACLALALAREAPVLTADRAWADLDIGLEIQLIR